MKKLILLITFLLLWAGWYFSYPYLLMWFEGFSFFSTLPDFTWVHYTFPEDIFRYVGSFLLQFYAWPAAGAAIQAALPIVYLACLLLLIKALFKRTDGLLWLAFIPLPFFVFLQLSDMTLVRAGAALIISAMIAVAAFGLTFVFRKGIPFPEILRKPWISVAVPLLAVFLSLYILQVGPLSSQHEDIARLEHYGERQEWGKILETVSPQDAKANEYKRKYVLLALSETGQLPEYAFTYGLSKSDDFYFPTADGPLSLDFNIIFYRALGLENPVVYHAYQQSLQSHPGISFDALRMLADLYIECKDYNLAKKYVDILSHSLTHGKWVKERRAKLEEIKDAEPEYLMRGERFVLESFIKDMSSLVTRYPDNCKFADYLLCGILADKDGNIFHDLFLMLAPRLYGEGKKIPSLYQEALLLIASQEPEILDRYPVDEEVWKRFNDFTGLMQKGKTAQAKRKYAGTYWAYVY